MLSIFQEKRIISDETARFEELLVRQRDFFVEEELREKYKRLISFVQQTEATMSSGEAGRLPLRPLAVMNIVVLEYVPEFEFGYVPDAKLEDLS